MKSYGAYLIDLDGTIYRGNQVIDEAPGFIRWLKNQDIPFLFLTNNSSLPPQKVAQKLQGMGIACETENVFTTSMAAAEYIHLNLGKRVYAIGEEGLVSALQEQGCELTEDHPEVVVIGIDRQFTYEKMAKASLAIQQGAVFLSTNSDRAVPTERGLVPGNGALTASIQTASGTAPIFIGKPEALFVELALQKLKVKAKDVLLIGDNLHTDILAGVQAQVDTLLVYTGITRPEDPELERIRPTYAVHHLLEWVKQF
ncbi:TIGR01457 family HAD-type hydrolase [Ammoniphilus sp. YIM 78166]|uniref:TIGR01457 family HAD-type hydrolase n=1 Tax=Ammoniphilus sp. YIM 78166 TaxID=1644106 RepID=UPI00106FDA15|nr:TIGR01457 family HAD-type hydrolase [Ammoniphilus sp. YIM 78166]